MKTEVPNVIFRTRQRNDALEGPNPFEWKDVSSEEVFANKRIVLFAIPGAFTPTCSTTHLPGYEAKYAEFEKAGVDEVMCLSVNDAFVMYQWGLHQGAKNVKLLPDGSGKFSRLMGMLVDKENLGFGMRSWRYSMVVDNGQIVKMFVEAGLEDNCATDPFEVSDADTMLAWLQQQ